MQPALDPFPPFRDIAAAFAALALMALPAAADPVSAVAAASDGRALEAIFEKHPEARDAVTARAAALGLSVIDIAIGSGNAVRSEARVSGGARSFTDCEDNCPPMVVMPASPAGFVIGSPEDEADRMEDEAETPVTIRPFAIGTRPVTVAEYKVCMAAGGCPPPEWLEPDGQHNIETGVSRYYRNLGEGVTGDRQPIVGVSHNDATAYAKWLSQRTGHTYRLPSEAEWEFAARAGTRTTYWWGNVAAQDGKPRAACDGCGSEWDGKSPAPAEAFDPNPWGLYSVHGNVWEWMADFYCDDYGSGPKDGSPRITDDCAAVDGRRPARGVRVLRGGSSFYSPKLMRAAMRARNLPDFRNFSVGFRIARDLQP